MRAGKLDRRIAIQRATSADDGFTERRSDWADLARVWAEVTPISDGERWRASEIGASVTDRFRIRWQTALADLNAKDRILYNELTYDITGVKEIGRREGLEITAMARSDQ